MGPLVSLVRSSVSGIRNFDSKFVMVSLARNFDGPISEDLDGFL